MLFGFIRSVKGQEDQKEKTKVIGVGFQIGESTGISLQNIKLDKKIALQLDFGVHELLHDYNYINKYDTWDSLEYAGIYSSSLNLINKINKNGQFGFFISSGLQMRIVRKYSLIEPISIPNVLYSNDPIIKTTLNYGINIATGLYYQLGNFWLQGKFGIYSEVYDQFLWSNPQYGIGVAYLINKN